MTEHSLLEDRIKYNESDPPKYYKENGEEDPPEKTQKSQKTESSQKESKNNSRNKSTTNNNNKSKNKSTINNNKSKKLNKSASYFFDNNNSNSNPLLNPELITKRNVIINNSTSKAMPLFAKAERFKKTPRDTSSFFYNIPSMFDKRSASIGYGTKYNIKPSKDGKCDNIYNIPREFDLSKNNGTPKYTFGLSRDVCKMPTTKNESQLPGPCSYSPYKKFGENSLHYSMSFRYDKRKPYNNPGPGAYNFMQLNQKGTYGSSTLCNSQLNKFPLEERFKYNYSKYPGPGSYNSENLIKGNGVVYNSIFTNNLGKTMGLKFSKIGEKLITPGPGAYDYFSDFEGFGRFRFKKIRKSNSTGNLEEKK